MTTITEIAIISLAFGFTLGYLIGITKELVNRSAN